MAFLYRRNKLRIFGFLIISIFTFGLVWYKNVFTRIYKHEMAAAIPSPKSPGHNIHAPETGWHIQVPVAIAQPNFPKKNNSNNGRTYTLEGMKEQTMNLNFVQRVHNVEKFGDHRADDPVIVIQVHDRPDYLKNLLISLKAVQGIDSATLVISRDKYVKEIDVIVDNDITFCRYIEIFFPFSMQLFPDKFPGEDPNDCSRDLSKSAAKQIGCNNAEHPDMYGHYREVAYVQIKHHWFWKLNMIFSGIREIHDNTGPILFLEDDNYVAPDLIDVMRKLIIMKDSSCAHCLVASLGAYEFNTDYKTKGHIVDVLPWMSTKHNLGMMLSKQFYDTIVGCMNYFCTYDDYNWDWTLQSTALKCFPDHLHTLVLKVPRVYHLGCTGFHQKRNGVCNVDEEVQRLKTLFESQAESLFPHSFRLEGNNNSPNSPHVQNGGWGDIRDHALCKKYGELCKSTLVIQ